MRHISRKFIFHFISVLSIIGATTFSIMTVQRENNVLSVAVLLFIPSDFMLGVVMLSVVMLFIVAPLNYNMDMQDYVTHFKIKTF